MLDHHAAERSAGFPERLCDVVRLWADRSPEQPALVEAAGTWTYKQLSSQVSETQVWLLQSGVRPGDRVVIVGENCRAFVAILLAVAAIDAWPVLINARQSPREVDQICDHCRPRRSIYCTNLSPHALQHAKRHGAAVMEDTALGPIGLGPLMDSVQPEPIEEYASDRVAALIYTSGTTGLPKGVMLTHRNLLFVAAVSAGIRALSPADRVYGVLPMTHAVGLSVVLLGTLFSGGTLYLVPRFDPVAAIESFQKNRLTILLGTPSMFSLLLDYMKIKGLKHLRLPALRIVSSSGAPLQHALKSTVESALDLVLHNGYGVTECSPNIAQTRVESPRTDISVGQILPGVETQLVGVDGNPVADGEVGELWVRGPNVMKGYYRAPDETAAALNPQGWFNTRDLARFEDHYLFIVGRTKELIVRFGLNVYPAEVEAVLNSHPDVLRSAVIGRLVDGGAGGEEIIAFIQTKPNAALDSDLLADHAARHLSPYKRPSEFFLVSTMPVTVTGKVMKDELAKMDLSQRMAI